MFLKNKMNYDENNIFAKILRKEIPCDKVHEDEFSLFFNDITVTTPQKSLTFGKKACSGRNNRGVITLGNRGGGHKRKYRLVHFNRKEAN